jgi:signal transduction histidine kinase
MTEETEQHRAGRELRDVIDQLLVALRLEIRSMRQNTTAIDPAALDEMEAIVSEIERNLRTPPFLL